MPSGPCTTVGLIPVPGWVPQCACAASRAQLEREMGMLFLPGVEEFLPPLTSSLFQEILYMRLHQRIKTDASHHVSHPCTLQLRAPSLGDMAESLERAENPFPMLGLPWEPTATTRSSRSCVHRGGHVLQTTTACWLCRAGNFCISINSY